MQTKQDSCTYWLLSARDEHVGVLSNCMYLLTFLSYLFDVHLGSFNVRGNPPPPHSVYYV